MAIKTCSTCEVLFSGRSDRTFCSKECQNEHHRLCHIMVSKNLACIHDERVRRNYVILTGIFRTKNGILLIHQDQLFKIGFDLTAYETRKWQKNKVAVSVIGEYTFRKVENELVEVIREENKNQLHLEFTRRWERLFQDGLVEIECVDWRKYGHYFRFEINSICNLLVTKASPINRYKDSIASSDPKT